MSAAQKAENKASENVANALLAVLNGNETPVVIGALALAGAVACDNLGVHRVVLADILISAQGKPNARK